MKCDCNGQGFTWEGRLQLVCGCEQGFKWASKQYAEDFRDAVRKAFIQAVREFNEETIV